MLVMGLGVGAKVGMGMALVIALLVVGWSRGDRTSSSSRHLGFEKGGRKCRTQYTRRGVCGMGARYATMRRRKRRAECRGRHRSRGRGGCRGKGKRAGWGQRGCGRVNLGRQSRWVGGKEKRKGGMVTQRVVVSSIMARFRWAVLLLLINLPEVEGVGGAAGWGGNRGTQDINARMAVIAGVGLLGVAASSRGPAITRTQEVTIEAEEQEQQHQPQLQ